MPVIRLTFIPTACPIIMKHLFIMDVVCFVIGPNPGSSKSTWEPERGLLISASLTRPSDRHERCIVTCKEKKKKKKKTVYIFLSCAVIWILIFLLSSHFSKCVCVTLEAHQCLRLWVCNELMEKRPTVCWEKEAFLPETLFILCLCGNITDFALFFCICSILATNGHLAHKIRS